jgi:hypothetical protein
VAGLLAAAALAGAGTPAFAAEDPIIHGLVKDADGHKVDGWVEVTDSATDGSSFSAEYDIENGEYAFQLPAGSYKLRFDDGSGLATSEFYNDKATPEDATPVVVDTADRTLDPVVLALNPAVHGLVTAPGGNPLDGEVYAYAENADAPGTFDTDYTESAPFNSSQSDVLFPNLEPGRYKLEFVPSSGRYKSEYYNDKATLESATPVTVTSAGLTLSPVVLAASPSVRGLLTDTAGNPVQDGWVLIYVQGDDGWSELDERGVPNGQVDLALPAGHRYKFRFGGSTNDSTGRWRNLVDQWYGGADLDTATAVDLTEAGASLTTVRLAYAATSDVTGVVRDTAGHGVGGLTVSLYQYYGWGSYWYSFASTTTAADGSYELTDVGQTDVKVQVTDDEGRFLDTWYGGGTDVYSATAVTVGSAGATVEPIVVHTGASLSGRVTDAAGHGLGGIDVEAVDPDGGARSTRTRNDGSYSFTRMAPGSYRIHASDSELYRGGFYATAGTTSQLLLASSVALSGDQTASGKDIVLDSVADAPITGVDVTGTVTDTAGKPLARVVVAALPAVGTLEPVDYAVTDAAGRYRLVNLDQDEATGYKIVFVPEFNYDEYLADGEFGVMAAFYGGKKSPSSSPTVTVTRGATVTADQALTRLGGIKGRVTADDGAVEDGEVRFYAPESLLGGGPVAAALSPSGSIDLAADGTYTVTGIVPGSTFVEAWDDNHPSGFYGGTSSLRTAAPVTVRSNSWTTGVDIVLSRTLKALQAPSITGRPLVGQRLLASTGTWENDPDLDVQWLRDGVVIGTGTSHVVTSADAGKRLSVRVLAATWSLTGQATSASTAVVKYGSTVSATATYKKKAKKVTLTLTVRVPGLARPGGSVTVTDGRKKVGSASVRGSSVVLTLKKQKKGRHTYAVAYSGTGTVAAASTKVGVKVR